MSPAPERLARERLLQGKISSLADESPEPLLHVEMGTDIGLEILRPHVEGVLQLVRRLVGVRLELLPDRTFDQLDADMTRALELVAQLRDFTIARYPDNWRQIRARLIDESRGHLDSLIDRQIPVVAYLRSADEARWHELDTLRQRFQEESSVALTSAKAAGGDLTQLLESLSTEAQQVKVREHAGKFVDVAQGHESSATRWLVATGSLALLVTTVAFTNALWFTPRYAPATPAAGLQFALAKLIVFSILLTALIWCGKAYRAHRHNAVVNRHRANALNTFETFAAAAQDTETRNAILVQATQAIFAPQHTGYVDNDVETGGTVPILEFYRNLSGGK